MYDGTRNERNGPWIHRKSWTVAKDKGRRKGSPEGRPEGGGERQGQDVTQTRRRNVVWKHKVVVDTLGHKKEKGMMMLLLLRGDLHASNRRKSRWSRSTTEREK